MAEHCYHEQDWGRILTLIETHHKEIYGNGQPGIAQTVTGLSEKIDTMTQSIELLSTNVSALMKFEHEFTGAEKAKDKGVSRYIQIAGFVVAVIMAAIGYANLNRQNKDLKWEVGMVKAGQLSNEARSRGIVLDSLFYEDTINEN